MNLLPSSLLLLTLLHRTTPQTITGTYLPLAYTITYPQPEFLYERITQKNEHLTSSVYVVEGNELKAAIMIEGPVAPIDVDLNTEQEHSGVELQKFIARYEKGEQKKMFDNDIKPIVFTEMIDFEEEMERYDDVPAGGISEEEIRQMKMEQEERERRLQMQKREEMVARQGARREHVLQQQVENEFEYDDDFVKLQMEKKGDKRGGLERKRREDAPQQRRRLLEEEIFAGEAYEKTFLIESPGW
jgi:hypothetical protein